MSILHASRLCEYFRKTARPLRINPVKKHGELTMTDLNSKEVDRKLSEAFDIAASLYRERGFQRRLGFGKRPALISVDLANAWTRPGNPFTCDQEKMDNEIIPAMQRLLEACRAHGHPVIHVTTAFEIVDENATCLLYTSPSPRDRQKSRMPSSA